MESGVSVQGQAFFAENHLELFHLNSCSVALRHPSVFLEDIPRFTSKTYSSKCCSCRSIDSMLPMAGNEAGREQHVHDQ